MIRTVHEIEAHLPRVLAVVASQYFVATRRTWKHAATAGEFETCLQAHDVGECLIGACRGGHLHLVRAMIARGARWMNAALGAACRGGHARLATMMVKHGATDFQRALQNACRGGHADLVKYCLQHTGAPWGHALNLACSGGHAAIAHVLMKRTRSTPDAFSVCRGGNEELVHAMLANGNFNCDRGLWGACRGGHVALALCMIERGATTWNKGLAMACRSGSMELAQLMIQRGARNFDTGLERACRGGHARIVQLMLDKGARNCYARVSRRLSGHRARDARARPAALTTCAFFFGATSGKKKAKKKGGENAMDGPSEEDLARMDEEFLAQVTTVPEDVNYWTSVVLFILFCVLLLFTLICAAYMWRRPAPRIQKVYVT